MRVVVTHLTGSNAGERQLFDTERLAIGRARDCDVRLGVYDTRASSRHAVLVEERGRYELCDLGSKNGTFVNGKRIDRLRMHGGETVAFGFGGPQLHFEFYEELPSVRPSLDEPHEFPFRARYAWATGLSAAALVAGAIGLAMAGLVVFAIPAGLAAAALALLGFAAARVNITVGPEGIEHEAMFRTRRIAWDDVAALETVPKRTGMLSGPVCRIRGWKATIQFSPNDYEAGYLLARLIAEASAKEWNVPSDASLEGRRA
jgi:hypothetical protein